MKLSELKEKLVQSGIPEHAYSLAGGLPNEAHCIEQGSDGKWWTYYSERGQRSGPKQFKTEDEACDHFFAKIVRAVG